MRLKRVLIAAVALGAATALAIAEYAWVIHPRVDPPAETDAVYALASPGGATSVQSGLIDEIPGRILVISTTPELAVLPAYQTRCRGSQPRETICISPDPVDTRGEARSFTRLAAQRGWQSVTVVTHRSHVSRSRLLMERCFPGRVRMHLIPVEGRRALVKAAIYETGALLKAALQPRC